MCLSPCAKAPRNFKGILALNITKQQDTFSMLADMFVEEKSAGFLYGFPWEGTRARTERQMEMLKEKKKKKERRWEDEREKSR